MSDERSEIEVTPVSIVAKRWVPPNSKSSEHLIEWQWRSEGRTGVFLAPLEETDDQIIERAEQYASDARDKADFDKRVKERLDTRLTGYI